MTDGDRMRAAVTRGEGGLSVLDRPVPDPGPGELRVAVGACGVCGGDAAAVEGRAPEDAYPRVPGHELAGTVDAVGADVPDWSVGDRVAVGWYGGYCGRCGHCRRGEFVHCERTTVTGLTRDGGYAEYATVDRTGAAAVPADVDAPAAAVLACAGLTAYEALRNADADPGDTVAVLGVGGVGHLGVAIADAMGFETVAVSGSADKRDPARSLGADRFVHAGEADPATALRESGGAAAILATAPSSGAVEATLGGLAPGGELLLVGVPDDEISVPAGRLVDGRRSVRGWSSGTAADAERTLRFCAREGIDPVVETYPLDDAGAAYRTMADGDARFRAVLVP